MRLGQNACLGNCLDEFDKSGERSRAIMALLLLFSWGLETDNVESIATQEKVIMEVPLI
jgi:hypothetical protein